MIYYSSFIYTTGIDCIGRMLMIVRNFLMISVDKLLSITLIYSLIKYDVQYHEWRMNFHAHVYWYYVSFYLCICTHIWMQLTVDRFVSGHTHVCVLTSDRVEANACRTVRNQAYARGGEIWRQLAFCILAWKWHY